MEADVIRTSLHAMPESLEYFERERRRIDEQAEALARDKEKLLPPAPRHITPRKMPVATSRTFRSGLFVLLLMFVLFNLDTVARRLKSQPETIRVFVEPSQVIQLEDVDTGEISYVVELHRDDLPYARANESLPWPAVITVDVLLVVALAYTWHQMRRARKSEAAQVATQ